MTAIKAVALLLDNRVVRVCMMCERDRQIAGYPPAPLEPGVIKEYGSCRRHAQNTGTQPMTPDMKARMTAYHQRQPDEFFTPDLGENEVRRCYDCERERTGKTLSGSHGQCERHARAWALQREQEKGSGKHWKPWTADNTKEYLDSTGAGEGFVPEL